VSPYQRDDFKNILRLIVDPDAAGDKIVKAIAMHRDRTTTHFVREPDETRDALCERAAPAMGWTEE
jgi:hypothetical protein